MFDKLQDLFTKCWEKGTLPQDLRNAVILSLFKTKEERSDCSNYRVITLLSIAGKLLARVLPNRLIPHEAHGCAAISSRSVSYTHLTLPTRRTV